MMGTVQAIYFCFAIIVAFGVVYNGARIAFSERSRDLVTLPFVHHDAVIEARSERLR